MTKARALALLMFVVFLSTSFRKGWTRHETDFPNYYTAAVLVRQGAPLRCYYDWTWFQKQMILAGNGRQLGAYLPQTPLTMLPLVPIARFPVQTAKQIWLMLNLIFLAVTLWILSKATQIRIEYLAILVFFGYSSLQSNFRLGQYYVFLLFLLTLAFYCLEKGKSTTGGFLCGVALGLKLYGGPFLLYFVVKRNWKAVAGMLAASAISLAVAIALFGWEDVHYYGTQILPRSLEGEVIDPYNPLNGTLTTFLRHSFVLERDLNPHPLLNLPSAFFFLRTFIVLLILGYTLFGLASEGRDFSRRGFAWFTIAILLLSSNAVPYTYILLLLPVALLLPLAGPTERTFLIASYFVLNFYILPSLVQFFPKLCIVAVLYCVEGRHYWGTLRPKVIAAGLVVAVIVAGLDAKRHLTLYRLEPARHLQRLAIDRDTYLSNYPVVTRAGLFYQAMVPKGYVLRWSHNGQEEEFSFGGMAFHPRASSVGGPVYFELVKDAALTTVAFDPVTRQVTPIPSPPPVAGDASVLSPDGKWVAVESTQHGPKQIWLQDTATGRRGVVTGGNCNNSSPAWENSDHLIFASDCGRGLGMPVLYYASIPQDIHFH